MTRYTQLAAAWGIHLFTASGAVFGLAAMWMITQHHLKWAFGFMVITILIDSVDGFFARLVNVAAVTPNVDGALLDNLVDYFTYVILPSFFLLATTKMVPYGWHYLCATIIILAASYQFTQKDAKTCDHFFKGFPSYWNIVIFYLFFAEMNPWINTLIIIALAYLSFMPIKFVYPSRLDYLTTSTTLRMLMVLATCVWGVATVGLLWVYPATQPVCLLLSAAYVILYAAISIYRNIFPLTVEGVNQQ